MTEPNERPERCRRGRNAGGGGLFASGAVLLVLVALVRGVARSRPKSDAGTAVTWVVLGVVTAVFLFLLWWALSRPTIEHGA